MPCFNCAKHLLTGAGSVFSQTSQDWELIIIDDGSGDSSWEAVQALAAKDARIKPVKQENRGAAAARNHGLKQAQGRFTAFLDADDTWHPEFLESMLDAQKQQPSDTIVYCGWQNLGAPSGNNQEYIPPDYESGDKLSELLSNCPWPIHAALIPTHLITEAGGFDESFRSCMDYDLWLRIGTQVRLVLVPRVLAFYHHHDGEQITKNQARIALNHRRVQEKYLKNNPKVWKILGKDQIRALTEGELLKRGYICYWKRDLPAARAIFRKVMAKGYGSLSDWKYMLPSLLPISVHRALIKTLEKK